MATRRGDNLLPVVNGATKEGDIAHLQQRLPETATLTHMTDQALLALQGPKAVEALSRIAPGVEELGFMTGVPSQSAVSRPGSAAPAIPARTASRSPFRPPT
jgi:glycine cleavage system aminomethyltransferase T